MRSLIQIAIIVAIFLIFTSADDSGDKKRLQLKILRHQPCTSKPTPSERIRFSSIAKAPLQPDDERGEGCYAISGPVTVRKPIRGTIQIYIEAKTGSQSPPEKCQKADANNCGGVGSCVYCDVCQTVDQVQKKTSTMIKVQHNGKALDCENGINAGNYDNIKLSFCMPSKEEFFEAEGLDDTIWSQNKDTGHSFFMTMYIFNQSVNTLSTQELQKIATDNSNKVIGCHKIVGSLYDPNE